MTSPKAGSFRRRSLTAVAALVIASCGVGGASSTALAASAASAFGDLQGSWGGTGVVTYQRGTKERLRCRVQYTQAGPNDLQQALRCASDSYVFQINAYYKYSSGTLSGRWSELSMKISGTISGDLTNGRIDGSLHGPGFLASVKVNTTGTKQTVVIHADDQEITDVAIEVSKGGR